MTRHHFQKSSELPYSPDLVFEWHERTGALERISPAWQEMEVIRKSGGLQDGDEVETRVKMGPLWNRWVARHYNYQRGKLFCDEQIEGPFLHWKHSHRFENGEHDSAGCKITDSIEYELPLGKLGETVALQYTKENLQRAFDYRHLQLARDLRIHHEYELPSKKILIAGSSGFLGSHLLAFLSTGGHQVTRLLRRTHSEQPTETGGLNQYAHIEWDPAVGFPSPQRLELFDVIINLAGVGVADRRWNSETKNQILESRVLTTSGLANAIARLRKKPEVFLSASAIGIYGDRKEEVLDEASLLDGRENFLANVSKQWEAAAKSATEADIRTIFLRTGLVLHPSGGILKKMLPAFRIGAGSPLGEGSQFMSWISLDDWLAAILHLIASPNLQGPVNLVGPQPLSNLQFSMALAHAFEKRVAPKLPALFLRGMFGEMADQAMLASTRALPKVLLESGFQFSDADLESYIKFLLGKNKLNQSL